MKGALIILVLLTLLVGGYLVFRNLAGHSASPQDPTKIRAIDKAREGAEQLQRVQEEIRNRANEADR